MLASIVGTATIVRISTGMPSEKSRRGNAYGRASSVAAQFTSATPSSLKATTHRMTASHSHPGASIGPAWPSMPQVNKATMSAPGTVYASSGSRLAVLRTLRVTPRSFSASSSSRRPSSTR
jgi:hypothetical protein